MSLARGFHFHSEIPIVAGWIQSFFRHLVWTHGGWWSDRTVLRLVMPLDWRLAETWSRIRDLCDLTECEQSIQFQLKKASSLLLETFQCQNSIKNLDLATQEAVATGEALLILSDEKLSSYVYKDVPTYWRQLYTDSTLIKVSAIFALQLHPSSQSDNVDWLEMIKLLDMALIIAGAPGRGRRNAIFFLITTIQEKYCQVHSRFQEPTQRPEKRLKSSNDHDPLATPTSKPPVTNPIPVFTRIPKAEEFTSSYYQSPFIIKGYCKDWKALSTTPWKNIDYLKAVAGPGRVVPVEVGKSYTEDNWSQVIMSWENFLDKTNNNDSNKLFYLAQYNIFNQFPNLKDDIQLPEYVYCNLPPDIRPKPDTKDGVILNVWLGPAGTISPAHVDPYYNCYAQIAGRKHIWVADSKFTTEMYPFGSTSADQTEAEDTQSLQANYMSNTSQVDVFDSLENQHLKPLRDRFPDFVERVMPQASQAVLEEGDMLVMPPGWWHSMKSLQPSINVSMWF